MCECCDPLLSASQLRKQKDPLKPCLAPAGVWINVLAAHFCIQFHVNETYTIHDVTVKVQHTLEDLKEARTLRKFPPGCEPPTTAITPAFHPP